MSGDGDDDGIIPGLADVPFEQLERLRRAGAVSSTRTRKTVGKKKRLNKNRPSETPSNRPVPKLRQVVPPTRPKPRDPRFGSVGHMDKEVFRHRYHFLLDLRQQEIATLRRELTKTKDHDRRYEIQAEITKLSQQLKTIRTEEEKREKKRERRNAERDLIRQGKRPYHLKQSDEKHIGLVARYDKLKDSGDHAVEKYLEKKRRKRAAHAHKMVPRSRIVQDRPQKRQRT